jgi:hypothetical protein
MCRNTKLHKPRTSLFICDGIKIVIGEGRGMDLSTHVATIKIYL